MCRKAGTKSRRAGVRAPIVAWKPGNAGGAKGCREMESRARRSWNIPTAECRKAKQGRDPPAACGSTTGDPSAGTADAPPEGRIQVAAQGLIRVRKQGTGPSANVAMRPPPWGKHHRLESRMREIRSYGSEGGGAETNRLSLPLSRVVLSRVAYTISLPPCGGGSALSPSPLVAEGPTLIQVVNKRALTAARVRGLT